MLPAALRRFNLRLVDDWHRSYRWSSMQVMALAGVLGLAIAKCPEAVCSYVPGWIMSAASTFVLFAPVIAMGARLTTNAPKKDDEP